MSQNILALICILFFAIAGHANIEKNKILLNEPMTILVTTKKLPPPLSSYYPDYPASTYKGLYLLPFDLEFTYKKPGDGINESYDKSPIKRKYDYEMHNNVILSEEKNIPTYNSRKVLQNITAYFNKSRELIVKKIKDKKEINKKEKKRWNAINIPSWKRIKNSFIKAILAPETLIPLAGSILLNNNLDKKISVWASKNTPIFKSQENSARISDVLREVAYKINFGSSLVVPNRNTREFAYCLFADPVNSKVTNFLKQYTKRKRPNHGDDDSFPSGHTSGTAVNCMIAYRNLEYMPIPGFAKTTLQISLFSITATVAWARLEAKHHWPSDVLAGAALGNFIGNFIFDILLIPELNVSPVYNPITISPSSRGFKIIVRTKF